LKLTIKKLSRYPIMAALLVASVVPSLAVCATGDVVCQGGDALAAEITRVFGVLLPYAISILGLFIGWKLIRRMVKSGISG
jgi:hypothetical protein